VIPLGTVTALQQQSVHHVFPIPGRRHHYRVDIMSRRNNNQLPNNLPQLQNCIKRDPESYRDEFILQLRHFDAVLDVTKADPSACNRDYEDLVMFMAHVSHCYTELMADMPSKLVSLLRQYGNLLHPDVRLVSRSCTVMSDAEF
jgi:hypothetical protein